jgi:cytochrome c1
MRYAFLFTVMLPVLSAQDGTAIYKERCAKCHDMPAARVPSLATIKAMSGEAIYVALTNGLMKGNNIVDNSRTAGLRSIGSPHEGIDQEL